MPHFIIDCSKNVTQQKSRIEIMNCVYEAAESTELFGKGDIKVRINAFTDFIAGSAKDDFIHVFANIMEGRSISQKKALSDRVVIALKKIFPDVPLISINVRDFEKATYCNKTMVE